LGEWGDCFGRITGHTRDEHTRVVCRVSERLSELMVAISLAVAKTLQ
jgi:hypothetical protein